MFDGINLLFMNGLKWIHTWVGNYGWSVVVFTLLIRLVLLPLDIKSRRSMRAMNRIQPKLQALQKKYANDKEKLNTKTMELYKKEKVSPMSGCLPLLLQWPILIFMFTAMRVVANEQTILMIEEMMAGNAPTLSGWLWIKNVFQSDSFLTTILPAVGDQLQTITSVNYSTILTAERIEAAHAFLSSDAYRAFAVSYGSEAFKQVQLNFAIVRPLVTLPTSFANMMQYANGLFILPILAGVSQFFMTKFTNGIEKKDKTQELAQQAQQADSASNAMNSGFMKWFFPLFSLWICATSNSAFSIYWMVVNVISIAQSFLFNIYFDHQDAKLAAKDMTSR